MQNYQSSTEDKSAKKNNQAKGTMDVDSDAPAGSKSSFSSQAQGSSGETTGQLDTFVSFIKENWRTVLAELVAAGVSAYLSHDSKDKAEKTNPVKN